jgi:class 3 adenylate cyclase
VVLAVLDYFAYQRDRFQRRSDDLLHNILPDEIADRLKAGKAMIADDFAAASVLFADVVNFTPMSTGMRMESEGIAGSIQVGPATYELIKDAYVCEARGRIPVKGKQSMETYLLISGVPAGPAHGPRPTGTPSRASDHLEGPHHAVRDEGGRVRVPR